MALLSITGDRIQHKAILEFECDSSPMIALRGDQGGILVDVELIFVDNGHPPDVSMTPTLRTPVTSAGGNLMEYPWGSLI